jgi:hypothetical protein
MRASFYAEGRKMRKRIGMMVLMLSAAVVTVVPVQARELRDEHASYTVRDGRDVREVRYRRDCDDRGRLEHRRDRDDWYRR